MVRLTRVYCMPMIFAKCILWRCDKSSVHFSSIRFKSHLAFCVRVDNQHSTIILIIFCFHFYRRRLAFRLSACIASLIAASLSLKERLPSFCTINQLLLPLYSQPSAPSSYYQPTAPSSYNQRSFLCAPPHSGHITNMAANGTESFAPVLAALQTMQSNVDRTQKGQAHEFLEQFQKSVHHLSPPKLLLSPPLTKPNSERSLELDLSDFARPRCHLRGKTIRCHDAQGQDCF
jgi:hypothetical protein